MPWGCRTAANPPCASPASSRTMRWAAPGRALAPFIRALGPSVQAAASQAGMLYNAALDQAVMQVRGLPGLQLVRFDVKGVFDDIVATQGDADGINVTDACLSFGVAVHAVCK